VDGAWKTTVDSLVTDADLRKRVGQAARGTAETYGYGAFLDWFENYLKEVRRSKEQREGLDPIEFKAI
jgi:hypothetical protein